MAKEIQCSRATICTAGRMEYQPSGFDQALAKLDQALARLDRFNRLEARIDQLILRGRRLWIGGRKESFKNNLLKLEALEVELKSIR